MRSAARAKPSEELKRNEGTRAIEKSESEVTGRQRWRCFEMLMGNRSRVVWCFNNCKYAPRPWTTLELLQLFYSCYYHFYGCSSHSHLEGILLLLTYSDTIRELFFVTKRRKKDKHNTTEKQKIKKLLQLFLCTRGALSATWCLV